MDNSKMTRERWEQAVEAGSNNRNYRREHGMTETRDDAFVDGVQWADENPRKGLLDLKTIWHYTEKGEYPQVFGEYEKQHYPQIPCLVVEHNNYYGVRYWNCTEQCWDDEECDDYYCDKDGVKKWMYIDPLFEEE